MVSFHWKTTYLEPIMFGFMQIIPITTVRENVYKQRCIFGGLGFFLIDIHKKKTATSR